MGDLAAGNIKAKFFKSGAFDYTNFQYHQDVIDAGKASDGPGVLSSAEINLLNGIYYLDVSGFPPIFAMTNDAEAATYWGIFFYYDTGNPATSPIVGYKNWSTVAVNGGRKAIYPPPDATDSNQKFATFTQSGYNYGAVLKSSGGVDITTDTIKIVGVNFSEYTYSYAHQYISQVTPRVGTPVALSNLTAVSYDSGRGCGVYADPVTLAGITAGSSQIDSFVVFKDTGSEATSPIIGRIWFASTPIDPSAVTLPISVISGPSNPWIQW